MKSAISYGEHNSGFTIINIDSLSLFREISNYLKFERRKRNMNESEFIIIEDFHFSKGNIQVIFDIEELEREGHSNFCVKMLLEINSIVNKHIVDDLTVKNLIEPYQSVGKLNYEGETVMTTSPKTEYEQQIKTNLFKMMNSQINSFGQNPVNENNIHMGDKFIETMKKIESQEANDDLTKILKSCEELQTYEEDLKIGDEVIIDPKNFIATINSVITTEHGLEYGLTLKNGAKLRNSWPKKDLLLKKFDNTMFVAFLQKLEVAVKELVNWSQPFKEQEKINEKNNELVKENNSLKNEIERLKNIVIHDLKKEIIQKTNEYENNILDKNEELTHLKKEIETMKGVYSSEIKKLHYNTQVLPTYQTNSIFLVKSVLHHTLYYISLNNAETVNKDIDNLNIILSKISLTYGEFDSIFADIEIQELLRKSIKIISDKNRIIPRIKTIKFDNNNFTFYDLTFFIRNKK